MWTASDLQHQHLPAKERAALGDIAVLLTRLAVLARLARSTDPTLDWQTKAVAQIRDRLARVDEFRWPLVLAHAAAKAGEQQALDLLEAAGADLGLAQAIDAHGTWKETVVPAR